MPKPQIPNDAVEPEEAADAIDASPIEGNKGYNHISPSNKEIPISKIFEKHPQKWDHLIP